MSEVFSASVAVALENKRPFGSGSAGLILVEQKDSGKLGLIAGHMEKETHLAAAYRELFEETGLTKDDVSLQLTPKVLTIPKVEKTSIGIIFTGTTKRHIPVEGFVPDSQEVSLVKPFTIDELLQLVQDPDKLYKPEFNQPLLCRVIWSYISIKYDLDGEEFQHLVANSWNIPQEHRQLL